MPGLYTHYSHYSLPSGEEKATALQSSIIAIDANVLLGLYRYNERTAHDILETLSAVRDRLFLPDQALREFWRNRLNVISGLDNPAQEAKRDLIKFKNQSINAVNQWSKRVALEAAQREGAISKIEDLFDDLDRLLGDDARSIRPNTPTSADTLLARLNDIFEDHVGEPLSAKDRERVIKDGERRVIQNIPPGYMDKDKLDGDLPEGASGDYLVWYEILEHAKTNPSPVILITSDTKEDWWRKGPNKESLGPRIELVEEFSEAVGESLFFMEPADLLRHAESIGVGVDPSSVEDVERANDESSEYSLWTTEYAIAVLKRLDSSNYPQADVIREAIDNDGTISRARVYEITERDEGQSLRGFTRPVARITQLLQEEGEIPDNLPKLLSAYYDEDSEVSSYTRASHFCVPSELVGELVNID